MKMTAMKAMKMEACTVRKKSGRVLLSVIDIIMSKLLTVNWYVCPCVSACAIIQVSLSSRCSIPPAKQTTGIVCWAGGHYGNH